MHIYMYRYIGSKIEAFGLIIYVKHDDIDADFIHICVG